MNISMSWAVIAEKSGRLKALATNKKDAVLIRTKFESIDQKEEFIVLRVDYEVDNRYLDEL